MLQGSTSTHMEKKFTEVSERYVLRKRYEKVRSYLFVNSYKQQDLYTMF